VADVRAELRGTQEQLRTVGTDAVRGQSKAAEQQLIDAAAAATQNRSPASAADDGPTS
jgi:hypothetical protein